METAEPEEGSGSAAATGTEEAREGAREVATRVAGATEGAFGGGGLCGGSGVGGAHVTLQSALLAGMSGCRSSRPVGQSGGSTAYGVDGHW